MAVEIRPYTIKDLQACANLYLKVFNAEPWNDQWTQESAREYLQETIERKGFLGFVAVDGGKIVGLVFGHRVTWWRGIQFTIQEICVDRETQRRGLGSELLRHMKRELDRQGYKQINIMTSSEKWASNFFKKNGFVEQKDFRFYFYLYKDRAKPALKEHH